MDDVDEATALIPGTHRVIRWLGDGESAFRGALVDAGERQRVSIDAGAVDDALWQYSGAEHVAGVRDVARTQDGHEALLPWCADPLEVILARREAAARPLAAGEIVTLVGSLLRGIIEVAGRDLRGRWWLDDEQRPLFVSGEGKTCADASVEIIRRIRDECADRALERVLGRISDAAADHRVVLRSLDEWERDLTEHAAPRAIEVAVYAPELVREIPAHRARLPQPVERMNERPSLRTRVEGMRLRAAERWHGLRALVPRGRPLHATSAPRVPRARSASSRKGPMSRSVDSGASPRRRMLLVGAAVAGVVLVGGLLWPTAGEDSSARGAAAVGPPHGAAEDVPETPVAASESTSEPAPPAGTAEEAAEATPVSGSIEEAAAKLLKDIDLCRADEDAACEKAVAAGAGQSIQDRLGEDSAQRKLALIEDYGDIAVVRLGGSDGKREQMLVIARQDDEWLVRDVYDVADQPSEG